MTEWQPIETAPRDGQWMLTFGRHSRKICTYGVVQYVEDFDKSVWLSADDGYGSYLTPTHWMPLPEPPNECVPNTPEGDG